MPHASIRSAAPVILLALGALGVGLAPVPPALAQVGASARGDATVTAFGGAPFVGSPEGTPLRQPIVGMAGTPTGAGYWLVASDGGVFNYGDAAFAGSTGGLVLRRPVVAVAPTPSGRGYWLVASDGGVFAFGDAPFAGSLGNLVLNQPIVGATRAQGGYLLVAADGGVFAFGGAPFLGSAGNLSLRSPVVGMAATPSGDGYWLVASDGGVFAYGDAVFAGSAAGRILGRPVVGMAPTPSGQGYWLVTAAGEVLAFGDASGLGSVVVPTDRQVVAMAAAPGASPGYWVVTGRPPVTAGAVGPGVENLQRRLLELGYWGPVDGRFGALTTQQVYAFQKVQGLPRDGTLDGAEMELLGRSGRALPRFVAGGLTVEVDKTRQVILVVRDGQTQWVFNTSTGNNRPYGRGAVAVTPEGRFTLQRQINGLRVSALGVLFRPKYFVGGYAIHGSPSVPPFPASHGCVRVTNAAINFIWDNDVMPLGTPLFSYS